MAYVMGKSEKNSIFLKEITNPTDKNITSNQETFPRINERYDTEISRQIKLFPNISEIIAPFGSSSLKSAYSPQSFSDEPGPGSYNLELTVLDLQLIHSFLNHPVIFGFYLNLIYQMFF